MRVTIRDESGRLMREVEDERAVLAACDAIQIYETCPHCKRDPFAVRCDTTHEDDRGVEGEAYCYDCLGVVGVIRTDFDTIFGREEDRAMLLDGRPRVYWSDGRAGR